MKKRPNILWLCADQMRYDTVRALGNEYIDTPNLDRLCREGVAFDKAYVQNPVCTPSSVSICSKSPLTLLPSFKDPGRTGSEGIDISRK